MGRSFSLLAHPSTHSSYPGGPLPRDLGLIRDTPEYEILFVAVH